MPEATVDEDHLSTFRENYVRRAGKSFVIGHEPIARSMERPSNDHLGLGSTSPHGPHDARSLGVDDRFVGQLSSSGAKSSIADMSV